MTDITTLIASLENSQHKVITTHEGMDLLAVQMTREDLSKVLEGLNLLRSWHRDEKAMEIIHEAALLLRKDKDK
jgi:hypothetical protein